MTEKWIKLEDRSPDIGKRVAVYPVVGEAQIAEHVREGIYKILSGGLSGSEIRSSELSHWNFISKPMESAGCDYCGVGTWQPLLRIVDIYPNGDIYFHEECDDCDLDCHYHDSGEVHEDCETPPEPSNNHIDITIGIIGNKLMFEDKRIPKDHESPFSGEKRYEEINFCPKCGRDLRRK
jgi:hypothetical protein